MATPHIESKLEDIAPVVLMPGDPLRAKYIAENYLEDAKLVNSVRNMFGYTGTYKGKRVTVFASGMGIPRPGRRKRQRVLPQYPAGRQRGHFVHRKIREDV